jgi:catechol 2,3-dioxygenase-like lactoylglutathione lyase family enzyme
MLKDQHVLPTLPARDLDRARSWYADKLGLTPDQEPPDALLYRTGGDCWFLGSGPGCNRKSCRDGLQMPSASFCSRRWPSSGS